MIYPYASPAAGYGAAALWILAEFSLFIYFQKKMPRRLEGARLRLVRCLIWGLLTGLQIRQAVIPLLVNFNLRIFLLILYTMAAGFVSFPLAFYVTITFYLVKDICKMIILNIVCPVWNLPVIENPWLNGGSMAACALMQFLILAALGRHMKTDGLLSLKKADMAALLFPAIPYALIKYLQTISFRYDNPPEGETAVVCLMLCVCDLIIFLQTEYRLTTQHLREEAEVLRLRSQAQLAWYCQEQKNIEEMNKLYHDMKHHLNYIRSLSDNSKIQEYVGSIVRDMELCEMFSPTGSPVVDSVLARSGAACARLGIRLIPSVSGEIFEFVEPKDLLVILGNALDNALEAVRRLKQEVPDSGDPLEIVVRAGVRQNFAVLRVENPFFGQVAFDQTGAPRTTKSHDSGHGYGFKNIRAAARRYGGEVTVQAEGGLFILTVMMPITH